MPRQKQVVHKKKSGGASTSRSNAPYEGRFISEEREALFYHHFKDRNIAKGKIVDIPLLSRGSFYVGHRIRSLGWEGFISLSKNFYPELVREFYANLEYVSCDATLTSKVDNTLISIPHYLLRTLLDLPSDHLINPPIIDNTFPDLEGFDKNRDLDKLLTNSSLAPLREAPDYNKMNLNSRIIHTLITYNILPHTGSKTHVSRYGAFLNHCIHSGVRIDLAVLIFRHMFSATEKANMSLPYPSLLTLIFEHFNIDLRRHTVERYSSLDHLDAACIKKMNYRLIDEDANTWLHKSGEPDTHDGSWRPDGVRAPSVGPSRPNVRRRVDSPDEYVPESTSSSQPWESRLFDQMQAYHELQMASINSLSDSFQSFRTDNNERFNHLEERMNTWDEKLDELYDDIRQKNKADDDDDDDDDGDDDDDAPME